MLLAKDRGRTVHIVFFLLSTFQSSPLLSRQAFQIKATVLLLVLVVPPLFLAM